MRKKILSFVLILFMFLNLINIPLKANANIYLSDEIAQKFVNLCYTNSTFAASKIKAILTGKEQGTIDEIKDIYKNAAMFYGVVNQYDMVEDIFSGSAATAMEKIGYLVDFISGGIIIYENIDSFAKSENAMQRTVDAFQTGIGILQSLGAKSYVPPNINFALSCIEIGLKIGGILENAYFAEGLELYKMELEIEYNTGQELTFKTAPKVTGLGSLSQEQADAQYSTVYTDYCLKRIMDKLPHSENIAPTTYTLTLNSNTNEISNTSNNYNKNTIVELPELSQSGDLIFSGWYYDSNFSNAVSDNYVTMIKDLKLYAKWLPQYSYDSWGNNSISISKFNGCKKVNGIEITDITIPSTINGYTVTDIDPQAFENCDNLTSVIIPDSVNTIWDRAFSHCTNLTSISIPDSVTYIGRGAFEYCTSLMSITIPDGIEYIEDYTFIACKNLKNIDLPNSINFIGDYAFCGCESLLNIPISNAMTSIGNWVYAECYGITNFDIPNTIKSIGRGAFSNCHNITNVVIPDSVTSIKYAAFGHCLGLTNVFIPNSVTNIEDGAFLTCDNLSNITVDEKNMYFSSLDGHLLNKNKTKFIRYAIGKSDITYTIPNGVVSIADYAFGISVNGYTKLKELVIPNTITHIGESAFPPSLSTIYYSDSASEWRNILVGKNNSSLSTAKIIYNCKYKNDTMLITDDKTTTNICIRPEECFYGTTIVIAIYNDNKLVGIKTKKMTSYSEINYSHNSEHDTIKIMYLDNLSNLRPLKKNLNISSFNW